MKAYSLGIKVMIQETPQKVKIPGVYEKVLINNMDGIDHRTEGEIGLRGWQYLVLEMR